MAVLTYILGRSGTGKSYSMRNFTPEELGVVNVQGKILPFKGSGKIETVDTDESGAIVSAIKALARKYKSIVVDDFQYVMANEFMRRSTERGYDKFTDIARHAWDIANVVRDLPNDVIVYVLCHTDTDPDGFEKLKTIGKLLDEKIVLEGMSTIVLKTAVVDGQYMFLTQNNGRDTVKSPAGMFPSYAIDNDLKYVDDKIRNYYEIGDYKTDAEMQDADASAAKEDVKKPEEKKKRSRKSEDDKPKSGERSKRVKEELKKERAKVAKENAEAVVTENGKLNDPEVNEDVPFEETEPPKLQDPPKRKRRTKTEINEETMNPPEESKSITDEIIDDLNNPEPEEPPKRRRRRTTKTED